MIVVFAIIEKEHHNPGEIRILSHKNTVYYLFKKRDQKHIWDNDDKGNIRPYIGILIEMNVFKFFAP